MRGNCNLLRCSEPIVDGLRRTDGDGVMVMVKTGDDCVVVALVAFELLNRYQLYSSFSALGARTGGKKIAQPQQTLRSHILTSHGGPRLYIKVHHHRGHSRH